MSQVSDSRQYRRAELRRILGADPGVYARDEYYGAGRSWPAIAFDLGTRAGFPINPATVRRWALSVDADQVA
jgi:hypothetical protein